MKNDWNKKLAYNNMYKIYTYNNICDKKSTIYIYK